LGRIPVGVDVERTKRSEPLRRFAASAHPHPIVANNFNDISDLPMLDHNGGPVGLMVVV